MLDDAGKPVLDPDGKAVTEDLRLERVFPTHVGMFPAAPPAPRTQAHFTGAPVHSLCIHKAEWRRSWKGMLTLVKNTATTLSLHLTIQEWRMAGIFALAGLAAAGIPALTAYRKPV